MSKNIKKSKLENEIKNFYDQDGKSIYELFKHQAKPYLDERFYKYDQILPDKKCGSQILQKLVCNSSIQKPDKLDDDLVEFLNYIWSESVGNLRDIFKFDDFLNITHQQVALIFNLNQIIFVQLKYFKLSWTKPKWYF